MSGGTRDITGLLGSWQAGDPGALERLLPLIYGELRQIARNHLRRERANHTLQPTALVNEAYLRLGRVNRLEWHNRAQFFAICARVMRHVLIDSARAYRGAKRGGGEVHVTLDPALVPAPATSPGAIALSDAIDALGRIDARKARVVELRFFTGLDLEETAAILGVSTDTVTRDWKFAKSWLYRELTGGHGQSR